MMNSNSTLGKQRNNINHSTLDSQSKIFAHLPTINLGSKGGAYNIGGRSSMIDNRRENESINEVDSAMYHEG
jgi:hypothetical protein